MNEEHNVTDEWLVDLERPALQERWGWVTWRGARRRAHKVCSKHKLIDDMTHSGELFVS